MKSTRIQETKYKGYLIKPTISGFQVYRKDYFVAQYPTLQVAKTRIDKVVQRKQNLLGRDTSEKIGKQAEEKGQIDLF